MAFFICSHCGYGSGAWMGKCPDCSEWNTFKQRNEFGDNSSDKVKEDILELKATQLSKVTSTKLERFSTGIFEFDRVLGGGLTPGAQILMSGEPGVGKSTLLLQALQHIRTLYISGEEIAEQVKERAIRMEVSLEKFLFSDTVQLEGILRGINDLRNEIDLVVVDSLQTIYSKEVESPPGNITQMREVISKIVIAGKKLKLPIIIIGHVTKDGEIAGPKMIEHMVDTVLNFEGERISQFRILRASKNRFGSTDEIGIFEMSGAGLKEVNNPLAFLEDQTENTPGKAVVGVMEGKRPLFFEMQALAVPTFMAMPRRVVKGVDYNKVLLLLAVMKKHLHIELDKYDVYINVIGGVDVKSPAVDLGIVASLLSSIQNTAINTKTLFIGEVGLLGEIRKFVGQDRILSEAKRIGFNTIISSTTMKNIKEIKSIIKI
ncbi:MAG: DNA repair protein RadA [Candidatus Roizmanbacteria bacterium]